MDKRNAIILFVVDTSGSMHDQKIASVNAALTECMAVLKTKNSKQIIKVGFITFNDRMSPIQWSDQLEAPNLSVKPNESGFFSLTSYKCLYSGLYTHLQKEKCSGQLYIILITDGRITENRMEYDEAYEQINSLELFRNAKRYAAIVDLDMERELSDNVADNEILDFLSDFDARKKFRLAALSAEVSKFSFLADNEQENPFK